MAPDLEKRIPLSHWLMAGGTGPPPTTANLLRMSSERKAAYREEKGYDAEKKKARAQFEEQWGPVGLAGLASKVLGTNKRKKPSRSEMMRTYGPRGLKRDRAATYSHSTSGSAGDDDDAHGDIAPGGASDGGRASDDDSDNGNNASDNSDASAVASINGHAGDGDTVRGENQ